jgi:transcriptional regulator with XRE-family HTH domain
MNRIKEVLEEKGIKQTWLAEKLGKSYNMVNGYVQNRQQPRLEILNEIANILDVDIKDFRGQYINTYLSGSKYI